MSTWTCSHCGFSMFVAAEEFPVRCTCGVTDDGLNRDSTGIGDTIAKFTRKLGIRSCGGCKKRQALLNRLFPYRKKLSKNRCDVLNCYPPIDNPEWIKIRGDVYAAELRTAGLDAQSVGVSSKDAEAAGEVISKYNPRVFCNHAFFFPWKVTAELAQVFPKTNFLTINHCSQADLARSPKWMREQAHCVQLAQDHKNCFMGVVDSRNFLKHCGLERCITVPNLVRWPNQPATHRPKTDRPVCSIVGRFDPNKAIIHSILAAAINGRVDLLFILKKPPRGQLEDFCESVGVQYDFAPWSSWDDYLKIVSEKVSICFQPSFTESFNYVSVEHMALGIPVVGSPTVKFLPPAWQSNPDDPIDMSNTLDALLDDYETQSKLAVDLAGKVKKQNYDVAVNTYRTLSGKGKSNG